MNKLRRDAVARLIELRAERAKHPIVEPGALAALRAETVTGLSKAPLAGLTQVHVLARTIEQVQTVANMAANDGRHGTLYLDFPDFGELDEAIAVVAKAHLSFAIATPRILKPNEEHLLEQLAGRRPGAWLVRNLGGLSWLREHCPDATLIGDAGLNVANELSARFLVAQGLSRITPAYELSDGRMEAMVRRSAASVFEVVIHQHVPLFHIAHCLFARLSGSSNCSQCPHPCRQHDLRLRDRNGIDHPVRVDLAGRTTVFRGEIESRLDKLPSLRRIGVGHARVEFLDEGPDGVSQILGKLLAL